jgi:hypothetical protein
MLVELDLIPMPENKELLETEDTIYLVIDNHGVPHTAVWDGEDFWLDGSVPADAEDEQEGVGEGGTDDAAQDDAIDLVWIAKLPYIPAPQTI